MADVSKEDAEKWLKTAIKLHEKHMDGSEKPNMESQEKMMNQMKAGLAALTGKTVPGIDPEVKPKASLDTSVDPGKAAKGGDKKPPAKKDDKKSEKKPEKKSASKPKKGGMSGM